MRWVYTEGAGLWWLGRYIALAEIFINLILNVLLVQYWGVLGIIVATLFSLFFVNFICSAQILFRYYFRNNRLHVFFTDHVRYFMVTAGVALLCHYLCERIFSGSGEYAFYFGIPGLGLRFIVCTAISVAGYFLVYHRSGQYRDAADWLMRRYKAVSEDHKADSSY
jgi:O-antigen/teichoic acid export membrane protein